MTPGKENPRSAYDPDAFRQRSAPDASGREHFETHSKPDSERMREMFDRVERADRRAKEIQQKLQSRVQELSATIGKTEVLERGGVLQTQRQEQESLQAFLNRYDRIAKEYLAIRLDDGSGRILPLATVHAALDERMRIVDELEHMLREFEPKAGLESPPPEAKQKEPVISDVSAKATERVQYSGERMKSSVNRLYPYGWRDGRGTRGGHEHIILSFSTGWGRDKEALATVSGNQGAMQLGLPQSIMFNNIRGVDPLSQTGTERGFGAAKYEADEMGDNRRALEEMGISVQQTENGTRVNISYIPENEYVVIEGEKIWGPVGRRPVPDQGLASQSSGRSRVRDAAGLTGSERRVQSGLDRMEGNSTVNGRREIRDDGHEVRRTGRTQKKRAPAENSLSQNRRARKSPAVPPREKTADVPAGTRKSERPSVAPSTVSSAPSSKPAPSIVPAAKSEKAKAPKTSKSAEPSAGVKGIPDKFPKPAEKPASRPSPAKVEKKPTKPAAAKPAEKHAPKPAEKPTPKPKEKSAMPEGKAKELKTESPKTVPAKSEAEKRKERIVQAELQRIDEYAKYLGDTFAGTGLTVVRDGITGDPSRKYIVALDNQKIAELYYDGEPFFWDAGIFLQEYFRRVAGEWHELPRTGETTKGKDNLKTWMKSWIDKVKERERLSKLVPVETYKNEISSWAAKQGFSVQVEQGDHRGLSMLLHVVIGGEEKGDLQIFVKTDPQKDPLYVHPVSWKLGELETPQKKEHETHEEYVHRFLAQLDSCLAKAGAKPAPTEATPKSAPPAAPTNAAPKPEIRQDASKIDWSKLEPAKLTAQVLIDLDKMIWKNDFKTEHQNLRKWIEEARKTVTDYELIKGLMRIEISLDELEKTDYENPGVQPASKPQPVPKSPEQVTVDPELGNRVMTQLERSFEEAKPSSIKLKQVQVKPDGTVLLFGDASEDDIKKCGEIAQKALNGYMKERKGKNPADDLIKWPNDYKAPRVDTGNMKKISEVKPAVPTAKSEVQPAKPGDLSVEKRMEKANASLQQNRITLGISTLTDRNSITVQNIENVEKIIMLDPSLLTALRGRSINLSNKDGDSFDENIYLKSDNSPEDMSKTIKKWLEHPVRKVEQEIVKANDNLKQHDITLHISMLAYRKSITVPNIENVEKIIMSDPSLLTALRGRSINLSNKDGDSFDENIYLKSDNSPEDMSKTIKKWLEHPVRKVEKEIVKARDLGIKIIIGLFADRSVITVQHVQDVKDAINQLSDTQRTALKAGYIFFSNKDGKADDEYIDLMPGHDVSKIKTIIEEWLKAHKKK